ncbi:LysR family transcriptional regulator [Terrabacter ginsenosidimutans]
MESRELRYFVTVAEEGSFTRAAARLFMTQPALSRAIRQMERDLGAVLLLRTNKGASLTLAGQVLLREGRNALEGLDRAESRTRAVGDSLGDLLHPRPALAGPSDGPLTGTSERGVRPPLGHVRPGAQFVTEFDAPPLASGPEHSRRTAS